MAAGEYVLGTLDPVDEASFRRALAADGPLRAEVYAWQDRLLAMTRLAAAADPSPALWRRIDAAITDVDATRAAAPAPSPAVRAPVRARSGAGTTVPWWERLGLWQAISTVAVAACLVMAVLLVDRGPTLPRGTQYIALLQAPDSRATGWIVQLQGGTLRLSAVGEVGTIPAGRAWQFWTKPEGAAAPTSLGLLRAGEVLELPLSALPAAGPRQLFEITLEPESGSPTGRPTGPILFVGSTTAL